MVVLSVDRVCQECGAKEPHEVKQALFARRSITEIENLGLRLFSYKF